MLDYYLNVKHELHHLSHECVLRFIGFLTTLKVTLAWQQRALWASWLGRGAGLVFSLFLNLHCVLRNGMTPTPSPTVVCVCVSFSPSGDGEGEESPTLIPHLSFSLVILWCSSVILLSFPLPMTVLLFSSHAALLLASARTSAEPMAGIGSASQSAAWTFVLCVLSVFIVQKHTSLCDRI